MKLKLLLLVIILQFINEVYATQIIRDIPYTYDGMQTLDLLLPEDAVNQEAAPRPAALVIHSGGLIQGSRYEIEFIAEWFATQGFVVINVDYGLAPEYKWPAQFADVIQAVWWLKENAEIYNINPDKILAVGASAGGYLAAMLGQSTVSNIKNRVDSQVHGVVSFAGPWNLLEATTDEQVYYIRMVLPVDTPQARLLSSPVYLIHSNSPPALLFHGTDDKLVPFKQSKYACEVYASKGLDHCFLIALDGDTHSEEVTDIDNVIIVKSIEEFLTWWLTQ